MDLSQRFPAIPDRSGFPALLAQTLKNCRNPHGLVRPRLRAAASFAAQLESESASSRIELLQRMVVRVVVAPFNVEISLRSASLWDLSAPTSDEPSTMTVVVPVQLKRCGLGVRLIVKGPDENKAAGPNPRLIALLVKAQQWFARLSSGQNPSVLAIAQELSLTTKEVTRVIYLAFLAPDIVLRIVQGEHPIDLGVKRLLAMAPLPLDWGEQRRVLGISS